MSSSLERQGCDRFVALGGLVVDYPGRQIAGVGLNQGWYYSVGADDT